MSGGNLNLGGRFKILSLISERKPPTSVQFIKPAFQDVRLNDPVQIVWSFLSPISVRN